MNNKQGQSNHVRTALIAALCLLMVPAPARAQYVWDGSVDSDFTNGNNWVGDTAPPLAVDDELLFYYNTPSTVTGIDGDYTDISGLNFSDFNGGSNVYTLSGSGSFSFNNSGGTVVFKDTGLSSELHSLGNIGLISNGTGLTFSGYDCGMLVYGVVSGESVTIEKMTGAAYGEVLFAGVNTYTGGTTIDGAFLYITNNNSLGSGPVRIAINNGRLSMPLPVWLPKPAFITLNNDFESPAGLRFEFRLLEDDHLTINGVLSGAGQYYQSFPGELTLTGDNTFSGGFLLTAGTVVAGHNNAFGTGVIDFYSNPFLQSNDNSRVINNDITINNNCTLTVSGAYDMELRGVIWGNSANGLTKSGSGTLTLSGVNTYGGNTTLSEGILNVTGTVAGNAIVTSGLLRGAGTFGSDLTLNGGTFTPGDSIGTTVITGNYGQNAGSTLEVEVEKTAGGALNSDLLDVSGTATLKVGSTINVVDTSSNDILLLTGDTFTIINAASVVTDNGPTITDSSAVLSFSGQVNSNSYELVTSRTAFAGLVRTNKSLMAAIDSDLPQATGDYAIIINALSGLGSAEEVDNAAEQLSPRPHASATYVNMNTGYRLADDIAGHLRSRRMETARRLARDSQARRNQLLIADASSDPRKLASLIRKDRELAAEQQKQMDGEVRPFFRPIGVFYDRDSLSKMTGFRARSVGGQLGFDKSYGPNLIAGIAGGYTRGWIKYKDSRGEADIDSLRIGPYASYFKDNYFIDASFSFGYHFNKSERNIRFGAIDRTAKGDYDAFDISAYVGGGYDIYARDWKITPVASLQLTNYHRENFKETGAGAAGIMVDSSTSNSLRSRLGVICSTITQIKGRTVAPELFAGWSHEFIDDEDISGSFVNGSAKFSSGIDSGGDDRFYYGAGMTALLKENISAYIRYEGEQLSGGNSHTFNAGVKILF